MEPPERKLATIILAAGGSSRLGRPKQLLEIDGKTLLLRGVDAALAAGCGPVIVVVGRDAEACKAAAGDRPVVWGHNADWASGLGGSIHAGVRFLLDATTADRVVQSICPYCAVGCRPVAVAAYADTVGPPVLASGAYLLKLRNWPADRGAKALWTSRPDDVRIVDCPEAAADVDTPADYERLMSASQGSR